MTMSPAELELELLLTMASSYRSSTLLLMLLLLFTWKGTRSRRSSFLKDVSLSYEGSEMMVILSLRIIHCSRIVHERNFCTFQYCFEYMNQ
ncbi:hypothetical protein NE237_032242 [Protea cynaroides]|uniref:Uncharacterized protein n=1 Tax=Protea cynaroides TaxID=273540 RepID=A0A9Q0R3C7_9MAGN|nr:hypothetical protein NE237_032242 [Protea cynaroides]